MVLYRTILNPQWDLPILPNFKVKPKVILWGSCNPRRELLHVDDLAKALVNTMANGTALNKTYFAETESLSIGEIWRIVFTKVHNRSLLQLKIPSLRFFFGRLHSKLPLTVSNLFID